MNDFTKKELLHISLLFGFIKAGYQDFQLDEDLLEKIEYMIEEHEDNYAHCSECPECHNKRLSSGICWHVGCDYRE